MTKLRREYGLVLSHCLHVHSFLLFDVTVMSDGAKKVLASLVMSLSCLSATLGK